VLSSEFKLALPDEKGCGGNGPALHLFFIEGFKFHIPCVSGTLNTHRHQGFEMGNPRVDVSYVILLRSERTNVPHSDESLADLIALLC